MLERVFVQRAGVIVFKRCHHLGGEVHLLRVVAGAYFGLLFYHRGVLVASVEGVGGRLGCTWGKNIHGSSSRMGSSQTKSWETVVGHVHDQQGYPGQF